MSDNTEQAPTMTHAEALGQLVERLAPLDTTALVALLGALREGLDKKQAPALRIIGGVDGRDGDAQCRAVASFPRKRKRDDLQPLAPRDSTAADRGREQ